MPPPDSKSSFHPVVVFALLMGIWLVFSGLFDAFHLALGVISCAFVTWLSSDLLFVDRDEPLARRLCQTRRLAGYLAWLLGQIVVANLHLLRLAFGRRADLHPQVQRYETGLRSDFEKFLLANSITLTPGTVTVKILGDTFYIHAISDRSAGGLDGEMERRIARIFAGKTNGEATSAGAP